MSNTFVAFESEVMPTDVSLETTYLNIQQQTGESPSQCFFKSYCFKPDGKKTSTQQTKYVQVTNYK